MRTLQHSHHELLHDTTYWNSREKRLRLLACFSGDALAQVMSFAGGGPSLTMTAVSRKARVYAALRQGVYSTSVLLPIDLSQTMLRYVLGGENNEYDAATTLKLSMWWLAQGGFHVDVRGSAAAQALLSAPQEIATKARAVTLYQSSTVPPTFEDALQAHLQKITIARHGGLVQNFTLSLLVNLRALSLQDCTPDALRFAQQLPRLTSLSLGGLLSDTLDMAEFACAAALQSLAVSDSLLEHLEGFDRCGSLAHTELSGNRFFRRAAPVAEAPMLRTIDVSHTAVVDVGAFGMCRQLELLRVAQCEDLTSLAPLAWAPRLRAIQAERSGVRDINGLNNCPLLDSVDFSFCRHLVSLAPLDGAPKLREVKGLRCGVADVDGLCKCPLLEAIHLVLCDDLASLAPLAGAPRLQRLDVGASNVVNIDGLGTCPLLESVNFFACKKLRSLAPLAGAPGLRRIEAGYSSVSDIDGLHTCPLLEQVHLSCCDDLKSVAPLAGARRLAALSANIIGVRGISALSTVANLRYLNLTHTGVSDLSPLAASAPVVEELLVKGSVELKSIAVLAKAARLRRLDLDGTGVSDLSPLTACAPVLEELRLKGCRGVKSIAALSTATKLRTLDLTGTRVVDLSVLPAASELRALPVRYSAAYKRNSAPPRVHRRVPLWWYCVVSLVAAAHLTWLLKAGVRWWSAVPQALLASLQLWQLQENWAALPLFQCLVCFAPALCAPLLGLDK